MSRPKGTKNRNSAAQPEYTKLPTEERLVVIANLIVDRIIEDQQQDNLLLRQLLGSEDEQPAA